MTGYPKIIARITNEPASLREVFLVLLFDCALLVILLSLACMVRGR